MKKLTLFIGALMIAGATFAQDGAKKDCCKKGEKKECCKKGEKKECCKKGEKKDDAKTSTTTEKKS
ncbi:hypothetical protein [Taibaiella soli]|uniref:Uncharacterized protein n=1 Tax=Taibaiella soli TaxID=1649169 RepID=A0A2W2AWT9_9BACT|nr:hypothetical protein [Taibaiella soli]PZF72168.1 hypothetical protein DN068_14640 [Taibaiella soli]